MGGEQGTQDGFPVLGLGGDWRVEPWSQESRRKSGWMGTGMGRC